MYTGPGIYLHHKGRRYFVVGLALHSETGEEVVVYRPLYDTAWKHMTVRPRAQFDETLGGMVGLPRFERET